MAVERTRWESVLMEVKSRSRKVAKRKRVATIGS
jgi:hypothetical protein